MGSERVVIKKKILSEDHVSAAVLEDFESDRGLQPGGECPGRIYLANRFLKSAVCELQRALIVGSLANVEAECLGIAKLKGLGKPSE